MAQITADSINITVDGELAEAQVGETVLTVCRRMGKDIPTLCHHEGVEPYAACRVCLVEVTAGARQELVPSCQYPVSDGLVIQTDSQAVRDARRVVLELLLARCPKSDVVVDLARRYGVTETPYPTDDPDETCILCGLCVRVCEDVLGVGAIGFADRGIDREVGVPFDEASEVCIGCGACVAVCPTGHVCSIDDGLVRRMETWKTELELEECEVCGRPFATVKQLDHIRGLLPEHVPLNRICPVCRRSQAVQRLSEACSIVVDNLGATAGQDGIENLKSL
ncbi:MAG: (2Fe-2S)-binding protein [Phycisphaerae bacterium]|nr:(2Fe-2S)-binding protein [Phycisphaerae bacterium]